MPQHIQNTIIREYCKRKGLEYVLSRSEYHFGTSTICQLYACLGDVYTEIVMYSVLQLPVQKAERHIFYSKCIGDLGKRLHFACEGLEICRYEDIRDIELVISLKDELPRSGIAEVRNYFCSERL